MKQTLSQFFSKEPSLKEQIANICRKFARGLVYEEREWSSSVDFKREINKLFNNCSRILFLSDNKITLGKKEYNNTKTIYLNRIKNQVTAYWYDHSTKNFVSHSIFRSQQVINLMGAKNCVLRDQDPETFAKIASICGYTLSYYQKDLFSYSRTLLIELRKIPNYISEYIHARYDKISLEKSSEKLGYIKKSISIFMDDLNELYRFDESTQIKYYGTFLSIMRKRTDNPIGKCKFPKPLVQLISKMAASSEPYDRVLLLPYYYAIKPGENEFPGHNCVRMLLSKPKDLYDIPMVDSMTIALYIENQNLTRYWIENNQLCSQSLIETEWSDMASCLPEPGGMSTDKKLISMIVSKYDCAHRVNKHTIYLIEGQIMPYFTIYRYDYGEKKYISDCVPGIKYHKIKKIIDEKTEISLENPDLNEYLAIKSDDLTEILLLCGRFSNFSCNQFEPNNEQEDSAPIAEKSAYFNSDSEDEEYVANYDKYKYVSIMKRVEPKQENCLLF